MTPPAKLDENFTPAVPLPAPGPVNVATDASITPHPDAEAKVPIVKPPSTVKLFPSETNPPVCACTKAAIFPAIRLPPSMLHVPDVAAPPADPAGMFEKTQFSASIVAPLLELTQTVPETIVVKSMPMQITVERSRQKNPPPAKLTLYCRA